MKSTDYTYSFTSPLPANKVFSHLLDVRQWWTGLFNETIEGKSEKIGDEFLFTAGEGVHYSKQKLVEAKPNERITWLVTESKLSFLEEPNEWDNTKICFDIIAEDDKTRITFTHKGLSSSIECYDSCSSAWTQYMHNLQKTLN